MTSQWTKPSASVSVTDRASSTVPSGGAVHVTSGASPAPSHVNDAGIAAPSSHGPENCISRAVLSAALMPTPAAAVVVEASDAADGVLVEVVDDVVDVDEEVVGTTASSVGGGAT